MTERERKVVHPLEVVNQQYRPVQPRERTVRGLEQAQRGQRCRAVGLENDCPEALTSFGDLAQFPQEVDRCSERHISLRLVPDDAELGQVVETIRGLGKQACLPSPWVAHDQYG